MESNNLTMPLSEGELWVSFMLEPAEDSDEEDIIPFRVPVQRSLLSSEESAKSIIPLLLSRTTLPEWFYYCPEFIRGLSEYVCSLPTEMQDVYVHSQLAWNAIDPRNSLWSYRFSTKDSTTIGDMWTIIWSYPRSGSEVLAVKDVKLEEASECAICLQDLVVGFEAAKLPCSHVYHRGCIAKWLDTSNKCPLCRSQVV
ncbi:putative RING-H2 finger protein ATL50 [Corylus avellana]|uniref:putative RING-H2 finger protein ATL50 n=1 Tax=Corylus avellana TaxID=13451 RepID=UPI00286B750A|nr:putative RING-H2 finger protein ATL50 [Corylus avellana]